MWITPRLNNHKRVYHNIHESLGNLTQHHQCHEELDRLDVGYGSHKLCDDLHKCKEYDVRLLARATDGHRVADHSPDELERVWYPDQGRVELRLRRLQVVIVLQ